MTDNEHLDDLMNVDDLDAYWTDIDDYPTPEEEIASEDAALEAYLSRQADEEAEAYAALPWWRRRLVDYREWRWRRKFTRRFGRDVGHSGTYDNDAPF